MPPEAFFSAAMSAGAVRALCLPSARVTCFTVIRRLVSAANRSPRYMTIQGGNHAA
ncbi:hypothetical protein BN135_1783 [Cronobacter muytjensii 530]